MCFCGRVGLNVWVSDSTAKGVFMKTPLIIVIMLALAIAFQSGNADVIRRNPGESGPPGGAAWPQDSNCMYQCPPDHPTQVGPSGPDGAVACDPAFITYDGVWTALKQVADGRGKTAASPMLKTTSPEIERTLTKSLDEARTLDRAWAVAMEVWRSSVSSALQRQALALVRSMVRPPADAEAASFMLSALDDPSAQMDRCRELGRGTPIERKTAAERLALLLQNPNLADRLK